MTPKTAGHGNNGFCAPSGKFKGHLFREILDAIELLEPFDEPTLEEVVREAGIILSHDDDNGGLHG